MTAAADGKLAAKSNNPFSAPGTDNAGSAPAEASQGAIDEGDIEAEGIESALVSLERVTAMLTINCAQGVSPGMKVSTVGCYLKCCTLSEEEWNIVFGAADVDVWQLHLYMKAHYSAAYQLRAYAEQGACSTRN